MFMDFCGNIVVPGSHSWNSIKHPDAKDYSRYGNFCDCMTRKVGSITNDGKVRPVSSNGDISDLALQCLGANCFGGDADVCCPELVFEVDDDEFQVNTFTRKI
jgi:hypothetical protein